VSAVSPCELSCICCFPSETNPTPCCLLCSDGAQPKRCFSNVEGYCRKKCRLVEISEMGCLHGKYCCVNELENKKHKKHSVVEETVKLQDKSKVQDYMILPTVTYYTISIWMNHLFTKAVVPCSPMESSGLLLSCLFPSVNLSLHTIKFDPFACIRSLSGYYKCEWLAAVLLAFHLWNGDTEIKWMLGEVSASLSTLQPRWYFTDLK
jgi:hypothetical protein